MGERQKETERPHNWSENVFPSSKTCRELHWNSCWKHQELWTLVGATLRGRPSGALKCTPPRPTLPQFTFNPNVSGFFSHSISIILLLFCQFSSTAPPPQRLSSLGANFAILSPFLSHPSTSPVSTKSDLLLFTVPIYLLPPLHRSEGEEEEEEEGRPA